MPEKPFWSFFQQTRKLFKEQIGASNKHDVFGWSMYQQTRPLYVPPLPLPAPPGPPTLTWPRKIYVATRATGVYYTDGFSDPSAQPTWVRINDGLVNLGCQEFHLDPNEPEYRQYVMTSLDGILYVRENGGAWVNIFDATDRGDLTGDYKITLPGGFYLDPDIPGRIWVAMTTRDPSPSWSGCEYSFVSDDYGATWTYGKIYCGPYVMTTTIRAHGDNAWTTDAAGVGVYGYMLWTTNKGATWRWQVVDLLGHPEIEINPLISDYVYYSQPEWSKNLGRFKTNADYNILQGGIYMKYPGGMWFDPDDVNHQRVMCEFKLYKTTDIWGTVNTAGNIVPSPDHVIAPWAGDNKDRILISTIDNHVISALYGEDDISAVGIAGSNTTVAPYVGSIPRMGVSGGVCNCGIQCIRESGFIYI